ncbi:MAG TPA: hypothetical protein PKD41_11320, partial [Solidesulfovibrio sp.]|nr:hypothetical protein [Solidesulfovibrio sp.]
MNAFILLMKFTEIVTGGKRGARGARAWGIEHVAISHQSMQSCNIPEHVAGISATKQWTGFVGLVAKTHHARTSGTGTAAAPGKAPGPQRTAATHGPAPESPSTSAASSAS